MLVIQPYKILILLVDLEHTWGQMVILVGMIISIITLLLLIRLLGFTPAIIRMIRQQLLLDL